MNLSHKRLVDKKRYERAKARAMKKLSARFGQRGRERPERPEGNWSGMEAFQEPSECGHPETLCR